MTRALAMILALGLLCTAAIAAEKGGVTFPETEALGDRTLKLNGVGIRKATFFGIEVYVAALYLEATSSDPEAILESEGPKLLAMKFVRDVGRDSITEAYAEGLEKNCQAACEELPARAQAFNALMTAMKDGDTMTLHLASRGVTVFLGGEKVGAVEGASFARNLLAVWLGPEPPNASLKEGLLGK